MRVFALFLVLALVQVSLVLANDLPKVEQGIVKEERTLSIIKPDAVATHHIGDIISRFEKADLHIVEMKMMRLNKEIAGEFYAIHKERPFYHDLVEFMASGPVVVMVLEGKNAVAKNREIMGATDPKKADAGTLRADFATSVQQNAVHGSDSLENAQNEILFFFPDSK